MIEMIRDPLTHIIRNAVDHGIEMPAERLERMSAQQKMALMFAPGLSTAAEVTAISGRGVGMDVVRANIERIGGVVDIDSRAGQGVRLVIRVPLTLTIIPALTVSAGGQIFAIPRSAIEEILRARGDAVRIDRLGEAHVATIRGRRVPLVSLPGLLGVVAGAAESEQKLILLKPAGGDVYALAVDAVHDHEELVVKPAAPLVMAAGLYAGTTLADDGRPILLLDPSGMASRAGVGDGEQEAERRAAPASNEDQAARESTLLLFRGLDGALRAVPVPVVERIEDVPAADIGFTAGRLRVSLDERILPLAGCAEPPREGKLRILRMTDGAAEIAYGFAEVVDIRALVLDLQPAPAPGEIAGVALIDGAQVELIDPYWLFAAHAAEAADGERPVCALPAGDPWMETILRPLIESLGYRVVDAGADVAADITVTAAEAPEAMPASGGEVLRLRARPEAAEGDDSIYRYDRAALIGALARAGKGRAHG
jgi:two-component system chemotaxis sensor kinase CheA